jgi:hypothetical protein
MSDEFFVPEAPMEDEPESKPKRGRKRREELVTPLPPPAPVEEPAPAPVAPAPVPKAVVRGIFTEYDAPDGSRWRCDNPDRMREDFGIYGDDLTRWHADVATVQEVWTILRRVYRLAPLMGSSHEELREWTIEEIAKESAVPVKRIETLIEETKVFWDRKNTERSFVDRAASSGDLKRMDDDQIEKLLLLHGFVTVGGSAAVPTYERRYLASRIVDFQHLLEDEQGAQLARNALMTELILRKYDREILEKMADTRNLSSTEFQKLVDARAEQQKAYEETLKHLGATHAQNPGFRAKMAFGDSVGHMVKAYQEFYRDGSQVLVDGMFTEAEVKLLMTPTTLRPAQYRPDLPLMVEEWRRNFWDASYDARGAALPRAAHRVLLAAFQSASVDFVGGKIVDMEGELGEDEADAALEQAEVAEPERAAHDEFGTDIEGDASMPMPEGGARMPRGGGDLGVFGV